MILEYGRPGNAWLATDNVRQSVLGATWAFLLPSVEGLQILNEADLDAADAAGLARLVAEDDAAPGAILDYVAPSRFADGNLASHLIKGPATAAFAPPARGTRELAQTLERAGWTTTLLRVDGDGRQLHYAHPDTSSAAGAWIRERRGDARAVARLGRARLRPLSLRLRRNLVDGRQLALLAIRPTAAHSEASRPARWLNAEDGWALLAPGSYPSQKVVFLAGNGARPQTVLKLPRDPAFNHRLEHEFAMLQRVEKLHLDPRLSPVPIALLRDGALAVLVTEAAHGRLLPRLAGRGVATGFTAVMGSLTELASRSRHDASSDELVELFGQIVEAYASAYAIPNAERQFLDQCVAAAGRAGGVPLVLQHGDPGIWNVMIDSAGRVTLLDWEAGEVDGLPLWDLFHFAGTYAHLDLGSLVPRSRLSRFGRHVFANSPLQSALVAAVRTYIDELQLPAALVEPLFVMGFVHRAWKQSFRLSTAARARGYYRRVVALTLASRDAAGYRRLLRL
jgi:hypothetical protein